MAESSRVFRIPKESMVGIWTNGRRKAWISDVREAEMGRVGDDCILEAKYVEADNTNVLEEAFDSQERIE
jgi:hypothetical protein